MPGCPTMMCSSVPYNTQSSPPNAQGIVSLTCSTCLFQYVNHCVDRSSSSPINIDLHVFCAQKPNAVRRRYEFLGPVYSLTSEARRDPANERVRWRSVYLYRAAATVAPGTASK